MRNWQNVSYKQTSKQTKIENFNFHNQIWNDVTAMNKFCFIHFVVKSFLFCENWIFSGTKNEKKPCIKWEKVRKPLSNDRKWAAFLPCYHVTDLISEQVSDFRFGHQKCPFWEWEKATFTAFPHVSVLISLSCGGTAFARRVQTYTWGASYHGGRHRALA